MPQLEGPTTKNIPLCTGGIWGDKNPKDGQEFLAQVPIKKKKEKKNLRCLKTKKNKKNLGKLCLNLNAVCYILESLGISG